MKGTLEQIEQQKRFFITYSKNEFMKVICLKYEKLFLPYFIFKQPQHA